MSSGKSRRVHDTKIPGKEQPTQELIEKLKDRELTVEQALDLEEYIYPLTKWED